jgi:hypothetical protein
MIAKVPARNLIFDSFECSYTIRKSRQFSGYDKYFLQVAGAGRKVYGTKMKEGKRKKTNNISDQGEL